MTGEDADRMWRAWEMDRDVVLCKKLLRYCAADVIALRHLATHLLGRLRPDFPWTLLDSIGADIGVARTEPIVAKAVAASGDPAPTTVSARTTANAGHNLKSESA